MAIAHFEVEKRRGVSIVTVTGNLDARSAFDLEKVLARLFTDRDSMVVLDMRGSGFVGSGSLQVLLDYAGRHRTGGGQLKICSLPAGMREVLEGLGADRVMPLFSDKTGALLSMPVEIRQLAGVAERRKGTDRRKRSVPIEGDDRRRSDRRQSISMGGF